MRILGAGIFLSLLAGKFYIFKQMLRIFKGRRVRILSARIFSKSFGGKIFQFEQRLHEKTLFMQNI